MGKMTSKLRTAAIGAVTGAALLGSVPANAGVVQLGFVLDSSGSIGSANWATITAGLANAINTLVPTNGQYEISVVTFASTAQTIVNHVLITDAATRTAVASAVSGAAFLSGSTAMDLGFSQMQTVLGGSTQQIDFSYVNLATDGVPNSQTSATAARNNLITAGVDNISIEAIGGGVDAGYLQGSICYPGPCDTTSPYNFPTQGFYIAVADASGFGTAVGEKITTIVQAPEPGIMAIFGAGLLGLGLLRRRKAA